MDFETVSPADFGASLRGLGLNLLVRDVRAEAAFLAHVFGMVPHRLSADFAIMEYRGHLMQLHADHTYGAHPILGLLPESPPRGAGAALHLFDSDPDEAAVRKARLEEAERRFDAARKHADRAQAAAGDVKMAGLEVARRRDRLDQVRAALGELSEAEKARTAAETNAVAARQAQAQAAGALAEAKAALEAAKQSAATAEESLRRAQRRQQARAGAARRAELTDRLRVAAQAHDTLTALSAQIERSPDDATLRDIERKVSELALARSLRDSAAPQLVMDYAAGAEGRARLGDRPLPGSEPLAIPEGAEVTLDGIGTLRISPGAGGGDEPRIDAAETALRKALAAAGAETPEDARAAAVARAQAVRAMDEQRARLEANAPEGLDALRQALAAIPMGEDEDHDPEQPDLVGAETRMAEATEARNAAQAARDTAGERCRAI